MANRPKCQWHCRPADPLAIKQTHRCWLTIRIAGRGLYRHFKLRRYQRTWADWGGCG
ncbi:MAG: hypothetical protein DRR08_32790 [Candidatus Parabeggiatoa sp. nov. 2]|nr:MAG: hypothetical protein DRR08_32790 [Gammaproteobacteria bacterium]